MSYHQLTSETRYQIYGLYKEGLTQKAIAENVGVHPATISRELRRNHGKRDYRPKQTHWSVNTFSYPPGLGSVMSNPTIMQSCLSIAWIFI